MSDRTVKAEVLAAALPWLKAYNGKIVVVKSSQHFYASYAPIARAVIYVDAPGSCTQDLRTLTFRKVGRPRWPL